MNALRLYMLISLKRQLNLNPIKSTHGVHAENTGHMFSPQRMLYEISVREFYEGDDLDSSFAVIVLLSSIVLRESSFIENREQHRDFHSLVLFFIFYFHKTRPQFEILLAIVPLKDSETVESGMFGVILNWGFRAVDLATEQ